MGSQYAVRYLLQQGPEAVAIVDDRVQGQGIYKQADLLQQGGVVP